MQDRKKHDTKQYNTTQFNTIKHITQNHIQNFRQPSISKITKKQEQILYPDNIQKRVELRLDEISRKYIRLFVQYNLTRIIEFYIQSVPGGM